MTIFFPTRINVQPKKRGTCLEFLAKTTSGILHMYIVIKVNFKTEIDKSSFVLVSQLNHTFKP